MVGENDLIWVGLALGVPMTFFPWLRPESRAVRLWCFRIICGIYWAYLAWRVTSTLPVADLSWPFVYAIAFLSLELLQSYGMYQFQSKLILHHDRKDEADQNEGWYLELAATPVVDLLIPTYNESWAIVEKTVIGALAQDYPNLRVWVCDDGRRPEFRTHAESLGAGYITRTHNQHAKAGNLNNALARLRTLTPGPDFVAVLDADFVPLRRFVSRAMTLLKDPGVGLVQTPQYHLNQDPLQSAFDVWPEWPDQQRYAFNVILPAFDARNAAYCCGTSFVARVEALNQIGGFPTEAVTEDVLTTIKMGMKGYRAAYLRERLTAGLAAEGMHEYVVQRGRWCLGSIQIGWWLASLGEKTRFQRIMAMEPLMRWGYWSLIRALMMTAPIIYSFTGVIPFEGDPANLLMLSFTLLVFERQWVAWISRGAALPIIQQTYNLLNAYAVIPALFKGLFDRHDKRFRVTDKGTVTAGRVVYWGLLRWLLGYLVLTGVGLAYGWSSERSGSATGDVGPLFLVWIGLTCSTVLVAAFACFESPRRRGEYRYAAREPVQLKGYAGDLLDLSVSGARIRSGQPLRLGEKLSVALSDVGDVEAHVVRHALGAEYGLAFAATDDQRHALIRKIFSSGLYVIPPERGNGIAATLAVLRRFACVFGLAERRNAMVRTSALG